MVESLRPVDALIAKWREQYRVAIEHDRLHGLRESTVELGGKAVAADELEAVLREQKEHEEKVSRGGTHAVSERLDLPQRASGDSSTPVPEVTCRECGCRTGGGEFCYKHKPYMVHPKKDGSFLVDRGGRRRVTFEEPPSPSSGVDGGLVGDAHEESKPANPKSDPSNIGEAVLRAREPSFEKNGIQFGERVVCIDVPRLFGTVLRCAPDGVDVRWDDGRLGELAWDESVAYNAYRLQTIRAAALRAREAAPSLSDRPIAATVERVGQYWQVSVFYDAEAQARALLAVADLGAAVLGTPQKEKNEAKSFLGAGEGTTLIAACEDCGLDYSAFPLDTVLSDADWLQIHPSGDGGLLCAGCIAKRVAALPTAIVLFVRIVLDKDHDAFRRIKNTPLAVLGTPPEPNK